MNAWISARPLVEELRKRWTGLKIEHLEACSSRAFAERVASRPGVTLLSFGASHSEIVLEAIRRGIVNQLIIGSDLEAALLAALPEGNAGKQGAVTERG